MALMTREQIPIKNYTELRHCSFSRAHAKWAKKKKGSFRIPYGHKSIVSVGEDVQLYWDRVWLWDATMWECLLIKNCVLWDAHTLWRVLNFPALRLTVILVMSTEQWLWKPFCREHHHFFSDNHLGIIAWCGELLQGGESFSYKYPMWSWCCYSLYVSFSMLRKHQCYWWTQGAWAVKRTRSQPLKIWFSLELQVSHSYVLWVHTAATMCTCYFYNLDLCIRVILYATQLVAESRNLLTRYCSKVAVHNLSFSIL